MSNDQSPSNVSSIADARKRKEEAEIEDAPFEAFAPQALRIQGDDWQVSACDGEQHYVYLVTKGPRAKNYKVTEVYPGLAKKRTAARDADAQIDLVFTGKFPTVEDALEDIEAALLGDLEDFEEGEDGSLN
jgi:hypothetical protein